MERKRRGFHCHLLPVLKLRTVPREGKEPLEAQEMKAGGDRSSMDRHRQWMSSSLKG